MLTIGIIIPNRNDRNQLLSQCIRMIHSQLYEDKFRCITEIISDEPIGLSTDITKRYRKGYESQSSSPIKKDILFFIENDDVYCQDYLLKMLEAWEEAGRPDLFGTNQTLYYHIRLRKYFTMYHDQRSSAMNTMIKPNLNFSWPPDHDPYTDQWLWQQAKLSKALFTPKKIISIGIKGHGMGMTGGSMHEDDLYRYINDDANMEFLCDCLGDDKESFEFYRNLSNKLNGNII